MPRFIAVVLLLLLSWPAFGASFPPAELLQELSQRLSKPAECQPHCATIQHLEIKAGAEQIQMQLEVYAGDQSAIPLPVKEGQWWPAEYRLDGDSNPVLMRDSQGILWILVSEGQHLLELSGPTSVRSQLDLPLPLSPARIKVISEEWVVNGLDENGVPEQQLQLIRKKQVEAGSGESLEPGVLPPLLEVTRILHFGIEWSVDTHIRRISPPGSPVTLNLALLPGEAVITSGLEVDSGSLQLRLPANQSELTFTSKITPVEQIILSASDDKRLSEKWQLDVGPVWHIDFEGLPVIHHQDSSGAWLPTWAPWPGEEVNVNISRPIAKKGNLLTIDKSMLEVTPGRRVTDSKLSFELRASRGGQHKIQLPSGAVLRSVKIDGVAQPVRQSGGTVSIPVRPGKQKVELNWRNEQGIGLVYQTPAVDLGVESVNHSIQVKPGEDRWTLFLFGPSMGPAVLFWSMMVIVVLLAFILARIGTTPLKWYHWLLLGIGLTQASLFGAVIIVAWLLVVGQRDQIATSLENDNIYNLTQVAIVILTVMALQSLFDAIRFGLLGLPEMQIEGNHSSSQVLKWYLDRAGMVPDSSTLISVPLLYDRLAMLAWALWLAFALLGWLKWSWRVFERHGFWKRSGPVLKIRLRRKNAPTDDKDKDPQ
ncbi:hypothetical protein JV46_02120 [Solemya velum gill symbiont]|uniref:Uncharacterized protein n=1 Tax=Solemya velum gill symbiont TaxID=2340 RepID=A0A0B0H810_SOVGS|nr:hypothetical protein [Solemya velum gill symbiont]KHF23999.1 hypothetical protein JV46_02120 [Solemya velum gill symbiont]